MEPTKRCPYCGEEILEVAKKCKYCGAWLEEKNPQPEDKKIPCPICGELIEHTATVCPYCHEKIEKSVPKTNSSFDKKIIDVKTDVRNDKGEKRKYWLWWLLGIIMAIIVAVVFIFKSDGSDPSNTMTVIEESPIDDEVVTDDWSQQQDHGAQIVDQYEEDTQFAGEWETKYLKDAFGDTDYTKPVYTVDLKGTTDVVHEGQSCILGFMVHRSGDSVLMRAFLNRNGRQEFWSETHCYVKLANGEKFEVPCSPEDGDLWFYLNDNELAALLNILNEGHFTLAITSRNNFGDVMNCIFPVGNQTTGIKSLLGAR